MQNTINEVRAAASDRRTISIPLEFRAAADGSDEFTLTGHAAVFERLSEDLGGFRERIKRGAFRKALDANQDVVLTYNHGAILARTSNGSLQLREDPRGLYVSAKVVPTSYARDLKMLMDAGVVSQMSFAFRIAEGGDKWTRTTVEGVDTIERDVVEVDQLRDVSVVDRPAYPQTSASLRELDADTVAAFVALVNGAKIATPPEAARDEPAVEPVVEAPAEVEARAEPVVETEVEVDADAERAVAPAFMQPSVLLALSLYRI